MKQNECPPAVTGAQIREARALLRWGQWRLARSARITVKVVPLIEQGIDASGFHQGRLTKIKTALEEAGIEFIGHGSPGVRLRQVRTQD